MWDVEMVGECKHCGATAWWDPMEEQVFFGDNGEVDCLHETDWRPEYIDIFKLLEDMKNERI